MPGSGGSTNRQGECRISARRAHRRPSSDMAPDVTRVNVDDLGQRFIASPYAFLSMSVN